MAKESLRILVIISGGFLPRGASGAKNPYPDLCLSAAIRYLITGDAWPGVGAEKRIEFAVNGLS